MQVSTGRRLPQLLVHFIDWHKLTSIAFVYQYQSGYMRSTSTSILSNLMKISVFFKSLQCDIAFHLYIYHFNVFSI